MSDFWKKYPEEKPTERRRYVVWCPYNGKNMRARCCMWMGARWSMSGVELWTYCPGDAPDRPILHSKESNIDNVHTSVRLYNSLSTFMWWERKIEHRDFSKMTMEQISNAINATEFGKWRNVGSKTVDELRDLFKSVGLKLTE